MSRTDRRGFLRMTAAAVGGLAACGVAGESDAAGRSADRAAAPSEPDLATAILPGLQLYTVRTLMERDVPGTLRDVAQIGYREVEFAGYFGRSPRAVRDLLDEHGLRAPSTHVALPALRDGIDDLLETARIIGHTYLTLPSLTGAERSSAAALRRVAETLNRAGSTARSAGMRVAYHNHDYEFASVDGVVPYDVLLGETDAELVSFELDVYWAFRAGRDPLALLAAHPTRFTMLHLKDSAGPPEHHMVDVGAGVLDFREIVSRSAAQGVQHAFVEHDRPAEPLASIRASFAHLAPLLPIP